MSKGIDTIIFENLVQFTVDKDLKLVETLNAYSRMYNAIQGLETYNHKQRRIPVIALELTKQIYER